MPTCASTQAWRGASFSDSRRWRFAVVRLTTKAPMKRMNTGAPTRRVSGVRLWMAIALAFALAFNIVRIFDFQQLQVRWDTNAYGSMTWFLLGLRPQRRYSFKMLCVVQTSDHSACTFVSPRSRKVRKPRACLICPITGSTIALRRA
jgi:hypothetical protein